MGWCSATGIFDDMAKFVLMSSVSNEEKYAVLKRLAQTLEEYDWDCQQDSSYYDDVIVRRVFKEMHPDWHFEPLVCKHCQGKGKIEGVTLINDPYDNTAIRIGPTERPCEWCKETGIVQE